MRLPFLTRELIRRSEDVCHGPSLLPSVRTNRDGKVTGNRTFFQVIRGQIV
jgi:hypothetical protein